MFRHSLITLEQLFQGHHKPLNWLAHFFLYGEYEHVGNHVVLKTRIRGLHTTLREQNIR